MGEQGPLREEFCRYAIYGLVAIIAFYLMFQVVTFVLDFFMLVVEAAIPLVAFALVAGGLVYYCCYYEKHDSDPTAQDVSQWIDRALSDASDKMKDKSQFISDIRV